LAPLAGRARNEQADACRAYLAAAHARIREAHFAGAPGDVTARAWSDAADEVVRALFAAAAAAHPGLDVAIVAVGGYGRGELCPYSDLDVWLLVPRGKSSDPRAQLIAEAILYPLWDLRMEVGHAVERVMGLLQRHPLAQRTQVVAQVQRVGRGLGEGEDPGPGLIMGGRRHVVNCSTRRRRDHEVVSALRRLGGRRRRTAGRDRPRFRQSVVALHPES